MTAQRHLHLPLAQRPASGPIFVAGVDPGKTKAGYALVTCGHLTGGCEVLDCGCLNAPGGGSIRDVMDVWCHRALEYLGRAESFVGVHVAVEGQWVPQVDRRLANSPAQLTKRMSQINAVVEVAANRGAWCALAESRGWLVDVIHPRTWRAVLGSGNDKRDSVKKQAVAAVRLRERQLFKRMDSPKRMPDHMAEAILIAEYRAKQLQVENLRRRT